MLAARAAPLGGHLAHLIVFAVWFGVIVLALLVDHVRGRNPGHGDTSVQPEGEPSAAEGPVGVTAAMPVSMATWPPYRGVPGRRSALPAQGDGGVQRLWLPLAVVGSLAAAAVHLVVMPDHFAESFLYGGFFAAAATAQIAFAFLLATRPTLALLRAGAAGNAAVLLLWAYTRVIGIPLGPDGGQTESVGALDLIAGLAELTVVVASVRVLLRHRMPRPLRLVDWSVPAYAASLFAASTILVTSLTASRG